MAKETQSMITEAIAAVQAGDKSRARELLTRLVRVEPTNAEYWIWLSAVVKTRQKKIQCLESALQNDPTNRAAMRGLALLGARKPDRSRVKIKPVRAAAKRAAAPAARTPFYQRIPAPYLIGGIVSVPVIGLLALLASWLYRPIGFNPELPAILASETPVIMEPTITLTPVPADLRVIRTAIPIEIAGTPIAQLVPQTPTPTVFLGATPDTRYEAHGNAIQAIVEGRFEEAITFADQVIAINPEFPVAHFLRAEALRHLNRPWDAIASYDRAVSLDPDYAAAFLGAGRALLLDNPKELPSAFQRALEINPMLPDTYLEIARFYANQLNWEFVEDTLQQAIDHGVNSPLVYIRISEAQYLLGNYPLALIHAIEGSAGDPTNLDGYLALGRAYSALDLFNDAIPPLQTFIAYRPEDHRGWGSLGLAWLEVGDIESAENAFETALTLREYAPAFYGRGRIRFQRGQFVEALNDFFRVLQFGQEFDDLNLMICRTQFQLQDYQETIKKSNYIIGTTEDLQIKAEAYAIQAQVLESTDPPWLTDAILYWQWALEIEQIQPTTRAMAIAHLQNLLGDEFITPTNLPDMVSSPTASVTTEPSSTPEPTSTPLTSTATVTVIPTETVIPTPTALPNGMLP